jgi:hypothetical protein
MAHGFGDGALVVSWLIRYAGPVVCATIRPNAESGADVNYFLAAPGRG